MKECLFLLVGLFVPTVVALWRRSHLSQRLATVSSVLAAYREGDFSIRARPARGDGLLDDVLREVNFLGDTLRGHRLGEMEAWALLRKVLSEVDVVVLAFNEAGHLKLANDAATRVLRKPAAAIVGRSASELGVDELLVGTAPRVVRDCSALEVGPWELRRGAFRLSGEPHALVVLSDVSSALREQEREAWKRLIRVMGHEINNSLAPIRSISDSLQHTLTADPRTDGWEEDVASGLSVIGRRAEALGRFMAAYAELARLPEPRRAEVDVGEWIARAVALERRVKIDVLGGPSVVLWADADQLDQLLINLLKNAAEASLERNGTVRVRWLVSERAVHVAVEDDGPGVTETSNLFVPFFTTKPGGSGIGLVLARQIAEAHGGSVSLITRSDRSGATAEVRLALRAPAVA
jgi:nitrogen fixation/metabolism regulation signal transduction histidine kinase